MSRQERIRRMHIDRRRSAKRRRPFAKCISSLATIASWRFSARSTNSRYTALSTNRSLRFAWKGGFQIIQIANLGRFTDKSAKYNCFYRERNSIGCDHQMRFSRPQVKSAVRRNLSGSLRAIVGLQLASSRSIESIAIERSHSEWRSSSIRI